ncbi:MAG TPA: amino acid ABC transporter permease [Candidatus Ruthenibacterium avium]|uniref:Amino acid ABC transporter permease n=1 Tax=Candidatus Ruthenibacterium avium TaxID=2838751 RepID=A0A9D2S1B9_9FIRM|nr:amino acid ABC transporter permease [Candidatus Ruthenibacterium avium]
MISLERMLKIWERYNGFYLEGLKNTLLVALVAVVLGIVLGLLVASGRMLTHNSRDHAVVKVLKAVVRFICTAYVEVLRATPLIVQVFVIYYTATTAKLVLPDPTATRMMWGMLAVALNSGAYLSEVIRSGIGAVPHGQMEAARCLGMSHWKAMRFVILPQAVRNILPALCNEFVTIIKETSVLSMVGIVDVMFQASAVASNAYIFIEPYIIAALMYFVVVFPLSKLVAWFERRMSRSVTR